MSTMPQYGNKTLMLGALTRWRYLFKQAWEYSQTFFVFPESQPYQDVDQGAVGGATEAALSNLRLDDEAEFPPMTHKNDWPG